MRFICRILFYVASLVYAAPVLAADADKPGLLGSGNVLMIQAAPTSIHYNSSPEYKGTPWLVGAELQTPSRWLGGYSYFNNSFDQRCHYLYVGYTWHISENNTSWYFKLTGGALYGYKAPYEDKIPYNHNGLAPAIIPGVGYKFDRFNVQLNLFGTAGIMITVGYDLFR